MQEWVRFYSPEDKFSEFSNFHISPIVINGRSYKSVEHYFQSQKYSKDIGLNLKFSDLIINQNTPGQAKILASPIKFVRYSWQMKLKEIREHYQNDIHFDNEEWTSRREDVMLTGLRAKFTQNLVLKKLLIDTGSANLSEDTRRDHFWGNGGDQEKIGKLGELLMKVRNELK